MKKPLVALLFLTAAVYAQTPEVAKFYKLDFVVKEVEGAKVLNSRAYSTTVDVEKGARSSIRTGSKVPVPVASGPNNTQFSAVNVGVNIDCYTVVEIGAELSLHLVVDVSSILQESPGAQPVTRDFRWESTVLVPLKKPTIVFTSDDATTRRQMQVELTATPLK